MQSKTFLVHGHMHVQQVDEVLWSVVPTHVAQLQRCVISVDFSRYTAC